MLTYKPELLVTASTIQELERMLIAGADAVIVGEQIYSMRMAGEMTLRDIETSLRLARSYDAKLYVAVNNMFHNEHLAAVTDYIHRLTQLEVDGITFGDPAILRLVTQIAPTIPLHWNAEMTVTNYRTAKYWHKRGARRVITARELNLEQVVQIKKQLPMMEVQVQIHGMTNIYHSKRPLITHYMDHLGHHECERDVGINRKLFLVEQERKTEKFPLYEDQNGTHMMSSDDICMLENIAELLAGCIDSFKIEGILKSSTYNETIVQVYRAAIDAYLANPTSFAVQAEWLERIQAVQDPERELSFGFFYKEQTY